MAITITLTDKTGTVKKIAGNQVYRTMSADALWYSSSANPMSVNDTLGVSSKDWILWEGRTGSIRVKFSADSLGSDGQGFSIAGLPDPVSVYSLSGTVYILRAQYINSTMARSDYWNSPDKETATTSSKLYVGDAIVCGKTSEFQLSVSNSDRNPNYFALPLVIMAAV